MWRWLSLLQIVKTSTEDAMLIVSRATEQIISPAFEDALATNVSSDITDIIRNVIDDFEENLDERLRLGTFLQRWEWRQW